MMEHFFLKLTQVKYLENNTVIEFPIVLNMNHVYKITMDSKGKLSMIYTTFEKIPINVKESYKEILKKLEESIKM